MIIRSTILIAATDLQDVAADICQYWNSVRSKFHFVLYERFELNAMGRGSEITHLFPGLSWKYSKTRVYLCFSLKIRVGFSDVDTDLGISYYEGV